MCKAENAHGPLRRIYGMLTDSYPDRSDTLRMRFAVIAQNETTGHKGLLPSLLEFGIIPSLGNTGAYLHVQEQSFRAINDARKNAATIIAEKKIKLPLKSNTPPSTKYTLKPGQKVMVYGEKMRKWVQDMRIVKLSMKQVC